jgi:TRAP-type C4-dicarboxylate transport system permease small subunit
LARLLAHRHRAFIGVGGAIIRTLKGNMQRIKRIASGIVVAVCIALWAYGTWNTEWDSWLSISEFLFPPIGIVRGVLLLLGVI